MAVRAIPDQQNVGYSSLTFSSDSRTILTRDNARIRIWDVQTGKAIRHIKGEPTWTVVNFVLSKDEKMLAFNSGGNHIVLVEFATGKHQLRIPTSSIGSLVAFSADGRWLLRGEGDLYDVKAGKQILGQLPVDPDQSHRGSFAGFSHDERALIMIESRPGRGDLERYFTGVRFFDLLTRKESRHIASGAEKVEKVCLSADRKQLAAWGRQSGIRFLDLITGKWGGQIKDVDEPIDSMRFSPDGKLLACTGAFGIRIWNLRTSKLHFAWQQGTSKIAAVALLPNGRTAAAAEGKSIRFYDIENGKLKKEIPTPAVLWNIAAAPNGKTIASGEGQGTVRLWSAESGKELRKWHVESVWHPASLLFSPDGRRLVVGALHHDGLRVWDPDNGKLLRHLKLAGHPQPRLSNNVAFSPNGNLLAAGSEIRYGQIFSGPNYQSLSSFGCVVHPYYHNEISSLAFSPDGKILVWTHWFGLGLMLLDVLPRQTRENKRPPIAASVARFAPDGWSVILGRSDGSVALWDPVRDAIVREYATDEGKVLTLAVSADCRYLVSMHAGGTALVWEAAEFAPRAMKITPKQREECWRDLAADDDINVYRALAVLAGEAGEAVQFLDGKWRSLNRPMPASVSRLLADLGSDRFPTRDRAMQDLRALGVLAESRLAGHEPKNLETRRRVEAILQELKTTKEEGKTVVEPDLLRALRIVTILDRIDTPQTRQSLQAMVRRWPETWLANEAQKALDARSKKKKDP
jgi:WD40 repeat protein